MLRQPKRGFWADTMHSMRVGILICAACVIVVAAVYAAPRVQHFGHSVGQEVTQ